MKMRAYQLIARLSRQGIDVGSLDATVHVGVPARSLSIPIRPLLDHRSHHNSPPSFHHVFFLFLPPSLPQDTAAQQWQQAGRAGRRGAWASVAVVVATERPLDTLFLSRPEALVARAPEAVTIDPCNAALLARLLFPFFVLFLCLSAKLF